MNRLRDKVHPMALPRLCDGRTYCRYGNIITFRPFVAIFESLIQAFPKDLPRVLVLSHVPRALERQWGFSDFLDGLGCTPCRDISLDIARDVEACLTEDVFLQYDIAVFCTNEIAQSTLDMASSTRTLALSPNPRVYTQEWQTWTFGEWSDDNAFVSALLPSIQIGITSGMYTNNGIVIHPRNNDPLNIFKRYDA